ncbi:MAG: 5'/3'-nucleotidase SurE [Actinomycetes bacterium]
MRRTITATLSVLALTAALVGCGGSDGDAGGGTPTRPTAKLPTLDILVTNDDGYAAPGIDALVERLRDLPGVEITVVAPATNQSGTSDRATPGDVSALTAAKVATASGFPATAVTGFPADSVNYALDVLDLEPDLVVAGSNAGQNLGVVAPISGTVGAARTAVRRGYPAVAVSQGLADPADFGPSVDTAVAWIESNRAALAGGVERTELLEVVNVNAPACLLVRGVVAVPLASAPNAEPVDCASRVTAGPDDAASFAHGFATVTFLTADTQTVTSTTSWPR